LGGAALWPAARVFLESCRAYSSPAILAARMLSKSDRAAAVIAVEKGLPALAGVDPLIAAALGERHNPHNGGTVNASYITAALMRHLGYVENGPGAFPDGVAQTGMRWKAR
jgi:hypothetical protein